MEFDESVLQTKGKGKEFKALPQWALFGKQDIPNDLTMSQ